MYSTRHIDSGLLRKVVIGLYIHIRFHSQISWVLSLISFITFPCSVESLLLFLDILLSDELLIMNLRSFSESNIIIIK